VDFTQIDWGWLILSLAVLLLSLSIHESAHAWAADRLGDPTGRALGRVTLNPLVHIDPIGTIVFPLVGFIAGGFIFGWAKPVPVNTANFKEPRTSHVMVAAAGPLSNIIAAVGFLFLIKAVQFANPGDLSGTLWEPIALFFRAGLILNIILAVFNLIPIPPLDGSWILEGVLPNELSKLVSMIRPYGFLLLLLLFYSGIIGSIIRPVLSFVYGIAY
jgi:Zn-dependent protease